MIPLKVAVNVQSSQFCKWVSCLMTKGKQRVRYSSLNWLLWLRPICMQHSTANALHSTVLKTKTQFKKDVDTRFIHKCVTVKSYILQEDLCLCILCLHLYLHKTWQPFHKCKSCLSSLCNRLCSFSNALTHFSSWLPVSFLESLALTIFSSCLLNYFLSLIILNTLFWPFPNGPSHQRTALTVSSKPSSPNSTRLITAASAPIRPPGSWQRTVKASRLSA